MELKYDTATEVTDKDNVYYVKAAEGKTEYVLELTLTDTTKKIENVYHNLNTNADARYTVGTRRPFFAPMTGDNGNTQILPWLDLKRLHVQSLMDRGRRVRDTL